MTKLFIVTKSLKKLWRKPAAAGFRCKTVHFETCKSQATQEIDTSTPNSAKS